MIATGFGYLSLLIVIIAFWSLITKKYPNKFFKYVPPMILVMITVVCCRSFGVFTTDDAAIAAARTGVTNYVIPLMVVFIAMQSDLRKMRKLGPKIIAVMVIASLSVLIGAAVAAIFIAAPAGIEEIPSAFGAWTAAFTGGVENNMAISVATGLSDDGYVTTGLLINLVYQPWITLIILLGPLAAFFNDKWSHADVSEVEAIAKSLDESTNQTPVAPTPVDMVKLMAVAVIVYAVGKQIGTIGYSLIPVIPADIFFYLFLCFGSVALGTFTNLGRTPGIGVLGSVLSMFSLSVVISNTDITAFFSAGTLALCGIVMLLIHAIIMVITGKLLKVDLCTLLCASVANLGGVSSAPVVSVTYSSAHASIAVIMAAIGSALGTVYGLIQYNLLSTILG